MINPNKAYKLSQIGKIISIQVTDPYIAKFQVIYKSGGIYEGYCSDINNFKRFKIGDHVKCRAQFSIVLDKFLVKSMRKVGVV
jgi:hypothetical protein